jgi:hypothetical protein
VCRYRHAFCGRGPGHAGHLDRLCALDPLPAKVSDAKVNGTLSVDSTPASTTFTLSMPAGK